MKFDAKPKKYECLLSDELYAEVSGINRGKEGELEIVFVAHSGDKDQTIFCRFASYVLVKFYEEMYEHESFVPCVECEAGGYLQRFGTILVYENSPYLTDEAMGSYFDKDNLPTHYHIVSGDDIFDILSFDKPSFSLVKGDGGIKN